MSKQKESQNKKKPYTKPEVNSVKLVAEEAVLADCKQSGAVGIQACGITNCGASTSVS